MLKSLEIENIAVIEKVSIDFDGGLSVLTGETGAGKSIIIDSINAVLGLRTSKDLVRKGAPFAMVNAVFFNLSAQVLAYLKKMDLEPEEDGVILQRKITAQGKSSCKINDRPVTAATMKELGELLINIHGQHDSQKLLDAKRHFTYIDELLQDISLLEQYRTCYAELVAIMKERKALVIDEDAKRRRVEQLQNEIDEIEKADIRLGEKAKLLRQKKMLNSLEAYLSSLNSVKARLSGDEEQLGANGLVCSALAVLKDGEGEGIEKLRTLLFNADEALRTALEQTNALLDDAQAEPLSLEEVEQRLSVYYEFSKRYGDSESEILDYLANAKKELANIAFADKRRAEIESEFEQKKEETYKKALALSSARKHTAALFEKQVEEQLHFLNMPHAQFKVDFQDGAITKNGIDTIEFLICVNAGESLKPLKYVASGGELSRIMLAFRAVLGKKEATPTLIFDEIDTGISGLAAGKVALKLQQVSKSAQVICVTHLAQIAAAATEQYVIEKRVENERTYTFVSRLDFEGRKEELARIMGGMNKNELMLANAQQLLKEYGNDNI